MRLHHNVPPIAPRNGFTLIESICAIAIAAIILTPLFTIENSMLHRIRAISYQLEALWYAKDFLYATRCTLEADAKSAKVEKQIPDTHIVVTYERNEVAKQSAVASLNYLSHEQLLYTWSTTRGTNTDTLVTFVYQPPSDEKKA